MLTSLTLRNFKIWRSTGLVKLAPVSLLLGTNSSGKSSIIQSLLLIRQTVRGGDPNFALDFGSEAMNSSVWLGQFSDVLNHGSADLSDKTIGIEFSWRTEPTDASTWNYSATYKPNRYDAAEIHTLRIGQGENSFNVKRQTRGAYAFSVGGAKPTIRAKREFRPQNSFTFSAATFAEMDPDNESIIRSIGTELLDELSKIIYLGPVRQLACRQYHYSGITSTSIGDDGSKAIDVLISSGLSKKAEERELFENTKVWLQKMDLGDDIEIRRLGKSPLYEVWISKNGSKSNLKDVGVGVSQVLPVIIAALHAEPGHIVMVEEPESHLHPLAQSILAQLFAKESKERGIQFIAETHSEHLFRRMQTLLAEQEVMKSDCAMYFVENEDGAAKFRPLEVDDFGRIQNWPDKFFGDSLGETKRQTDLMLQRLKESRAQNGS
jgi:predicted ATPase